MHINLFGYNFKFDFTKLASKRIHFEKVLFLQTIYLLQVACFQEHCGFGGRDYFLQKHLVNIKMRKIANSIYHYIITYNKNTLIIWFAIIVIDIANSLQTKG